MAVPEALAPVVVTEALPAAVPAFELPSAAPLAAAPLPPVVVPLAAAVPVEAGWAVVAAASA